MEKKVRTVALLSYKSVGIEQLINWHPEVRCPNCRSVNSLLDPNMPLGAISFAEGDCESTIELWKCGTCADRFMTQSTVQLYGEDDELDQLWLF